MVIDAVRGSAFAGIRSGIVSPMVLFSESNPSSIAMPIKVPVTHFVIERTFTGSSMPYCIAEIPLVRQPVVPHHHDSGDVGHVHGRVVARRDQLPGRESHVGRGYQRPVGIGHWCQLLRVDTRAPAQREHAQRGQE